MNRVTQNQNRRRLRTAAVTMMLGFSFSFLCGQEVDPDLDRTRRERLKNIRGRFVTPDGFEVQQAAPGDLVGSVVNMTFDHLGRPAISVEGEGISLLQDDDGDGLYETRIEFSKDVESAHGMHFLGPGDLLVNSEGPNGTGLYRLIDTDGNDEADEVLLVAPSDGAIQEHGPHAIVPGPDGYLYVLYGNHARPDVDIDAASPSRNLKEDQLLPSYLDPRGHANLIRAPGGTVHRLSPDLKHWTQIAGGFRNPFDIALNATGEIFTFEADMEWDLGLPWFRPIRVLHVVPGGDFGWRTGSGKFPGYYIDTLPSIAEIGRGSPVGIAFYSHHVYPARFHGALFMGDWSRGRIRVLFPHAQGPTYGGEVADFVLGEPLNVTDLDIGPDGFLYFSVGGRMTSGGIYRVRYANSEERVERSRLDRWLAQPMPRSAWGREALVDARESGEEEWGRDLETAARDPERPALERLRALEFLQVLGPKPSIDLLIELARDLDAQVRAAAVLLLGTHPLSTISQPLSAALDDEDSFVQRRACEALIRSGLESEFRIAGQVSQQLVSLLGHPDRHVRYAARLALIRVPTEQWSESILNDNRGALDDLTSIEGLLGLILSDSESNDAPNLFPRILDRLDGLGRSEMAESVFLDFLRVLQLALARFPKDVARPDLGELGTSLLKRFPSTDDRINRELQVVLAYLQPPGTIEAILGYVDPGKSQEDQIHSVYCLQAIKEGWETGQQLRLLAWFESSGWRFRGGASLAGFVDDFWNSVLDGLPPAEREAAEKKKALFLQARAARVLSMSEDEGMSAGTILRIAFVTLLAGIIIFLVVRTSSKWGSEGWSGSLGLRVAIAAGLAVLLVDLASPLWPGARQSTLPHMSFQELSDYLEYDPMSYERSSADRGRKVFYRARCVNCHVFGLEGQGGGPDLSTVVKRFRRREILESIMFPSRVISDQYTALRVETQEGDVHVGLFVGENEAILTLIDPNGVRIEIEKTQVTDRVPSEISIMPEGLLDTMTLQELVDLMAYLEEGSGA